MPLRMLEGCLILPRDEAATALYLSSSLVTAAILATIRPQTGEARV